MEVAAERAGTDQLQAEDWDVHFVAPGTVGPFLVVADLCAGRDQRVVVRLTLVDEGCDRAVVAAAAAVFHAEARLTTPLPSGSGFEDEREGDEASDHEAEVMTQRRGGGIDAEEACPGEELFEGDLGFDSCEGCTDAEVDAPAKADVVARVGSVEVDVVGREGRRRRHGWRPSMTARRWTPAGMGTPPSSVSTITCR